MVQHLGWVPWSNVNSMISCFWWETALFCIIMQWVVTISYRHFGTTYGSHLWGVKNFYLKFQDNLSFPIVCPKMSVRNYHYSLCNYPEQHSSSMNGICVMVQHFDWVPWSNVDSILVMVQHLDWLPWSNVNCVWVMVQHLDWIPWSNVNCIWVMVQHLDWMPWSNVNSVWVMVQDLDWVPWSNVNSVWVMVQHLDWAPWSNVNCVWVMVQHLDWALWSNVNSVWVMFQHLDWVPWSTMGWNVEHSSRSPSHHRATRYCAASTLCCRWFSHSCRCTSFLWTHG